MSRLSMIFKSNLHITAYALVAAIAGSVAIAQWGVLGQPNLKLTRVHDDKDGYNVATGRTPEYNVVVHCKVDNRYRSPDHKVYNALSDAEKVPLLNKHPGREYVSKPVNEFNFGNHHCFLLSVYATTLATHFEKLHYKKRVHQLPDILNQILLGTSYLHQLNMAHGNLTVNNIYINSAWMSKPRILISNFGAARSITYTTNESNKQRNVDLVPISVQDNYNAPPEAFLNIPVDPRRYDTWFIGSLAVLLLSGKYPYQNYYEQISQSQQPDYFITFMSRLRESELPMLPGIQKEENKNKALHILRADMILPRILKEGGKDEVLRTLYEDIKVLLIPLAEKRPTPYVFISTRKQRILI
ncbi:kinase-like domain-containing protein [Syncephalis plumigaleata]|nr:kinase-like domain-containing protein [Syncephalis plumigaleata]